VSLKLSPQYSNTIPLALWTESMCSCSFIPTTPFLEYLKALALLNNGTVPGTAKFNLAMAAARKGLTAPKGAWPHPPI
jgi:hypothetical protein